MLKTMFLAFLLLPFGGAFAESVAPPRSHDVYDVMREGSKIGTTTTDIDRQGDVVNVRMSAEIDVKIMYVSVYRFSSKSTEVWRGGRFVSYASKVDDNGTPYDIKATGAGDKATLDVNGKQDAPVAGLLPASMWNREFLKHTAVFDPDNGKRITLKVVDAGDEKIVVNGVSYQAHHYKISGDFARELWYDGDRLLRMRLVGPDKSVITSDVRAQS